MSKIIIELDKEEAEVVLETKRNGKILRDNKPNNVSHET